MGRKKKPPKDFAITIRFSENDQDLIILLKQYAAKRQLTDMVKLALRKIAGLSLDERLQRLAAEIEQQRGESDPAWFDLLESIRQAVREEMSEHRDKGEPPKSGEGGAGGNGQREQPWSPVPEVHEREDGIAAANPTMPIFRPGVSPPTGTKKSGGGGSAKTGSPTTRSSGLDMSPRRPRRTPTPPPGFVPPPEPPINLEDSRRLLVQSIKGYGKNQPKQ